MPWVYLPGGKQRHVFGFASGHMRPTAGALFSFDSAGARAAQLRAVAAVLAAMISAYRGPGEGDSSPLYSLHPGVGGRAGRRERARAPCGRAPCRGRSHLAVAHRRGSVPRCAACEQVRRRPHRALLRRAAACALS